MPVVPPPQPTPPPSTGRWPTAVVVDAIVLAIFVLVGRTAHDESGAALGVARTAWPFATGAAVGWLVSRGWRRPFEVVPTGLLVWVSTVVVGMILRAVSGQGAAATFILVAAVLLAILLLGWRALVDSITWIRSQRWRRQLRPARSGDARADNRPPTGDRPDNGGPGTRR